MQFRPVEGWGRLPEGWSYVEATSVAVDAQDNVWVFNRGRASGDRLRPRGQVPALVGRGADPARPRDQHRPRRHHLAHRRSAPHHPAVHAGGQAAADHRGSGPGRPRSTGASRSTGRPTRRSAPRPATSTSRTATATRACTSTIPSGRHILSWGEPGTDPGCFNIPHNIVTDAAGLVYVADRENSRVQIFDSGGKYLGQWNNLHRPCGLFADPRNDVFYVGELPSAQPVSKDVPNVGARVTMLSIKGEQIARVGGRFAGEKPGEFVAPHGVAVDSRGDFYVAEVSWTAQGKDGEPAARDPVAAEVREGVSRLDERRRRGGAAPDAGLGARRARDQAELSVRGFPRGAGFRQPRGRAGRARRPSPRHRHPLQHGHAGAQHARRRRTHHQGLRAGARDRPRADARVKHRGAPGTGAPSTLDSGAPEGPTPPRLAPRSGGAPGGRN